MTRRKLILILAATTALGALALSAARARDVPKVATGFVANIALLGDFRLRPRSGRGSSPRPPRRCPAPT